jgi:hypothetical protein
VLEENNRLSEKITSLSEELNKKQKKQLLDSELSEKKKEQLFIENSMPDLLEVRRLCCAVFCGSGIRDKSVFYPGSGSRSQTHIYDSLMTNFWVKSTVL